MTTFRTPEAPLVLDDERLTSYRHPSERRRLVVTILALVGILAVAYTLDRTLFVGMIAIYLFLIFLYQVQRWRQVVDAAEVTPTQFPELHREVLDLAARFGMPPIRVFVQFDVYPNAFAFGARAPYIIGITSGLLENMTLDEVRFVLGHEMGHVKFGHTRRALLLGGGGDVPLPPSIAYLDVPRAAITAWLDRAEEMTADRAGVVAVRGIDAAVGALARFHVGYRALDEIDLVHLAQQRAELRRFPRGLFAYLSYWLAAHPPFVHRLEAMVGFAGMPTRERLATIEDQPRSLT